MSSKRGFIVGIRAVCCAASVFFVSLSEPATGQEFCWEPIPVASPQPGKTSHHSLVYDSNRNVVVLFGGLIETGGNAHNETWEWSCTTRSWAQRSLPTSPQARYAHAMAYDSGRNVVVLFGGGSSPVGAGNELDDIWEYDGTTWTAQSPVCDGLTPDKRLAHAMVYDSCRNVVVLFGGHLAGNRLGDTWEWDGECWEDRSQSGPAPREYPAMAFDTNCCRTILFGGQDATPHFDDTWSWDGTSWTNVSPTTSPSPRYGSGMSFDSLRQRFVLFGGSGPTNRFGETWEFAWDCVAGDWAPVNARLSPAPRIHTGLTFDESCGRSVLLGGTTDSSRVNDTWLFPADFCVPTLSEWGVVLLGCSILVAGNVLLLRQRKRQGVQLGGNA